MAIKPREAVIAYAIAWSLTFGYFYNHRPFCSDMNCPDHAVEFFAAFFWPVYWMGRAGIYATGGGW